jgi:hypothetical protein
MRQMEEQLQGMQEENQKLIDTLIRHSKDRADRTLKSMGDNTSGLLQAHL